MPRETTRRIAVVLLVASLIAMAGGTGTVTGSTDEAHFAVEITGANAPVAEGETLVVNATITNTGEVTDSQQIHLKNADEEIVDSISDPPLTLAPGESKAVTLSWETAKGDAGTQTFSVQSNDESPHGSISIDRGAFFDLTIVDTTSPISAGEQLDVTLNVTMTGKNVSETDVWFALGGSVRNRTNATLVRNETRSIELSWNDTDDHAGEWPLTAGVGDERAETTVRLDATDQASNRADTSGSGNPETEPNASATSTSAGDDQSAQNASSQPSTAETSGTIETPGESGFNVGVAATLLGLGALVALRFYRG